MFDKDELRALVPGIQALVGVRLNDAINDVLEETAKLVKEELRKRLSFHVDITRGDNEVTLRIRPHLPDEAFNTESSD